MNIYCDAMIAFSRESAHSLCLMYYILSGALCVDFFLNGMMRLFVLAERVWPVGVWGWRGVCHAALAFVSRAGGNWWVGLVRRS